jgi:asparagine synthase (glutamine-hydrolysing)
LKNLGAIALAMHKRGQDVTDTVLKMLKELSHRGNDAYGISSSTNLQIANTIKNLNKEEVASSIVSGYIFKKILPRDKPQPVLGNGFALIFEGRIFPATSPEIAEVELILRKIRNNSWKEAAKIIRDFDGSYVFSIIDKTKIIVGRDPLGTCPLYYEENKDIWAAASEKKALWSIGLRNVEPFPPGNIAIIKAQNRILYPIKNIKKQSEEKLNKEAATSLLKEFLFNAVKNRTNDLKEIAVAFSGGLDSTIIAFLAKQCDIKVHLFSVGLEGREELDHAEKVASFLELPIHIEAYTQNDIEAVLPKILWIIEKVSPLDVGIAVPLYWTAENISKKGFKIMLTGQGSDELFAGYQKYVKIYKNHNEEYLKEMLFQDVVNSHDRNYQRDNKISAFHKLELRLPFTDWKLVNLSLSIPINLKIQPEINQRKIILRYVAETLGLPAFVINRPKKAIQYATGVDSALRTLSKKQKLNLQNYLMKHFQKEPCT